MAKDLIPDLPKDQPVALIADEVTYDNKTGKLTATGNVQVYYGERTLTADRIVYDSKADRVEATGKITIRNPDGTIVVADSADLDTRLRDGLIRGARSVIQGQAKFASVEARRVEDRYNVLSKAVFSPCEVCITHPTPLWRIRARKIVHDEKEKMVHYEDATFDVMGVPVAWLPYFRHPDPTVKRASGLLNPIFMNSTTYGYALKQPYFWVIDDQSDATITPFVTTGDGLFMEGEYRRLFANGGFQFDGSVGYGDYDGTDSIRGHVFSEGDWKVWDTTHAGFSIRQASDDAYLRRYDFSDEDRLTSEIFLRQADASGFADVSGLHFQSLRDDEPAGQIPLVFPTFDVRHVWEEGVLGGQFGFTGLGYALKRTAGQDTMGLSLGMDWEREYVHDSGLVFRGFGEVSGQLWEVNDNPALDDGLISRFSPDAGIEARYPLVRRDAHAIHVVEPIVQLVAAPHVGDPADIPNEDSQIVEFDETNLFPINRFPGLDGFEEGFRANLGMRYRYLADNGLGLSASFGRVFRTGPIDSFSPDAGLNGSTSDFVGAWTLKLPAQLSLTNRVRIGDNLTVNRNEVFGSASMWGLDLDGSYIYLNSDATAGALTDRQEAALKASYAIANNWTIAGHARRDLEEESWIDAGGSLTYSNECVDIDLYANRRFTSSQDAPASLNVGVRVRLWALGGSAEARPSSGRCEPVMTQ